MQFKPLALMLVSTSVALAACSTGASTEEGTFGTFATDTDSNSTDTTGDDESSTNATMTTMGSGDGDGDPAGAECGNSSVEAGEQCDLGPDNGETSMCTPDCQIAVCGDGYPYTAEECDDGNEIDTDECTSTCKLPICGDGFVHEGVEQCDDGNAVDDDGCTNACLLGSCGDGNVDEGEQCDDGNVDNTDDCLDTCQLAYCGDGSVQAGVEFCDGAGESADCDIDCTPAECGDGTFNAAAGEGCDDGNDDPTDACTTECALPACGDGYLHEGEDCDGEEFGDASCSDFPDFNSGDLACEDNCEISTAMCSMSACPDGGALVNDHCWYASEVCETTAARCQAVGLVGQGGPINTPWSQEVMDAVADQLGLISGGDAGCCVTFGWIEDGAIYTHNFGAQFHNWDNCYSDEPTLKACQAP